MVAGIESGLWCPKERAGFVVTAGVVSGTLRSWSP